MTEIKYNGSTYVGTAADDHGVFTNSEGTVTYAGEIVHRRASVGVATFTNGTTHYVECDADGKYHGRFLECAAGGDTAYWLYEHEHAKEYARLRAGIFFGCSCEYNGKACRADFAPFAALQAKVLSIKARPHQRPHSCIFSRPHRPPIGPPIRPCFGTRRSWRRRTPTRRALLRLHHSPAWAL
jgi:hypothetical protein